MSIDWNLARAFHATATTGSLSKAARSLGLTQPTLSRQIATLEAALNVILFERVGKSLILTETGQDIFRHVKEMGAAASAAELTAKRSNVELNGNVVISALDIYCAYILPPVIQRIREAMPDTTISLIATNAFSDLQRQEADIAVRLKRPDSDDLIGKLIYETSGVFYAGHSWIAEHGSPRTIKDILPESIICFETLEGTSALLRSLELDAPTGRLRILANQSVVSWELVKSGLGIGMMLKEVGDKTNGVQRVLGEVSSMPVPVWLVSNRALKSKSRVRLVYDLIAEELANLR